MKTGFLASRFIYNAAAQAFIFRIGKPAEGLFNIRARMFDYDMYGENGGEPIKE